MACGDDPQVLPEVIDAVGGRVEVLLDGGIRRGSDVVKALCLGARGVLVGRAYAYGLGAAGGPGVTRALEILRADITRTMKLLGCRIAGGAEPVLRRRQLPAVMARVDRLEAEIVRSSAIPEERMRARSAAPRDGPTGSPLRNPVEPPPRAARPPRQLTAVRRRRLQQ